MDEKDSLKKSLEQAIGSILLDIIEIDGKIGLVFSKNEKYKAQVIKIGQLSVLSPIFIPDQMKN